jgi:hypothetical protein
MLQYMRGQQYPASQHPADSACPHIMVGTYRRATAMWIVWAVVLFLVIWALWAGAWTLIFVGWDHLTYAIFIGMALVILVGCYRQIRRPK